MVGHTVGQILECLEWFKLYGVMPDAGRIQSDEKTPGACFRFVREGYSIGLQTASLPKNAEIIGVSLSVAGSAFSSPCMGFA